MSSKTKHSTHVWVDDEQGTHLSPTHSPPENSPHKSVTSCPPVNSFSMSHGIEKCQIPLCCEKVSTSGSIGRVIVSDAPTGNQIVAWYIVHRFFRERNEHRHCVFSLVHVLHRSLDDASLGSKRERMMQGKSPKRVMGFPLKVCGAVGGKG